MTSPPADRAERMHRLVDLLLICESLLAFAYCWFYFPISQGHRGDFLAILSNREEPSIWWDGEGLGYGPIFALYDLALSPLGDLTAMRVMFVVNLALLLVAVLAMLRTFLPPPRTRRETLVAIFVIANFYPLVHLLRQNNIEITEVTLLALAYFFLAGGKDARAGICYGLAAATKILPIVLLACLVWRRRWRALSAALVAMLSAYFAVAAIKHCSPLALYVTKESWPTAYILNQAVSGFVWRFFSQKHFSTPDTLAYPEVLFPSLAAQATAVVVLLIIGVVAVMLLRRCGWWPRPSSDPLVEVIEQQLVLLVVLLALPHSHVHYYGLVIPIYLIGLRLLRDGQMPAPTVTLLAASYTFLGMLMFLRLLDPLVFRRFPVSAVEVAKLYSVPFAGALLALVGLAQMHKARLAAATWPRQR
jgi:hypothetical protein